MAASTAESGAVDIADLVTRWDLFDPEHERYRAAVMAYARKHCPVVHTSGGPGGFYLVTRYDDARRVLQDWETFSSAESFPLAMPVTLCPVDSDPPLHTGLRQLLNPVFSRSYLMQYEPMMRSEAIRLIESWVPTDRPDGSVELIGDFAAPFVGNVLTEIVMGEMDEDEKANATRVAVGCAHHATPELYMELIAAAEQRLVWANENPRLSKGFLKAVTSGTVDGKPLSLEQQVGVLAVLFLGGLDTTRSAIAMIALRVAQDPSLEARVRNPEWVKHDLDEFLRIDPPVAAFARVATQDTEVGGVPIKKGERVLIRYDSVNRDESRFPQPDQLIFDDETRRPSNAAFGLGIHRCIGSNLARIQIPLVWSEILARVTRFRLTVDPGAIVWEPGIAHGPQTAPLAFDTLQFN